MISEYTDLYDENKKLTGEKIFREKGKKAIVPEGKFTIVVLGIIKNNNNEFLMQKTSARKNNVWAFPGGHVKSGQTSLEAIKEELKEEMNLEFNDNKIELFKTYKYENAFKDVYMINANVDLSKIVVEEDEVEKVEYLNFEKIDELINKDLLRKTNLDVYEDLKNAN